LVYDCFDDDFPAIRADSDRDYWLRADEAQTCGLIDEVLTRQP
jgi:ATP-dependent Clp protease protease subunit